MLTLGEKVVWYHDWALDQGRDDGAYISHASMAERLGDSVTAATVERVRQRLKRLGLHHPLRRRNARNLGWISTLPADCVAWRPADAPRCAAVLDQQLKQQNAWVAGEAVAPPNPTTLQPWTYFARAGDAIKIGQSWIVDARIKDLQTGQAAPVRLLGKTRWVTERVAHRQWAQLHLRGAWFRASQELLEWIATTCSRSPETDCVIDDSAHVVDAAVHQNAEGVDPTAAALGGRGETPFSASISEAQLPSGVSSREKGVGASAPKGREGRRRITSLETPLSADERAGFDAMLQGLPPERAAMMRRIYGL